MNIPVVSSRTGAGTAWSESCLTSFCDCASLGSAGVRMETSSSFGCRHERMQPMKRGKKATGFTAAEKEAMRARVREMKGSKVDGETEVLEKIDTMKEPDRALGKRLQAIIKAAAPELAPRLWYGMPAYAKDDKVLCFFQSAQK